MRYQNVFFDLDGTLVDSLPGIESSAAQALAECGYAARSQDLGRLIGPPIRSILRTLSGETVDARLDALERAFRASYDSSGWERTVLYDGARESLEALRTSGARLFLVTNKPRLPTERILRQFGLRAEFMDCISRDSASPAFASKAAMLCFAMERHGLRPESCVLVGDTDEDCDAASQAGIPVIVVTHGYGELSARNGAIVAGRVHRLEELMSVFNDLGRS
jgi:phosphoglycolate phosphatase